MLDFLCKRGIEDVTLAALAARLRAGDAMKTTLLALAFILCSAASARAHKPSDSYLTLRSDGAQLAAQWDIALRDLDQAIGLDSDGDGAITWGEVRARQTASPPTRWRDCRSRPTARRVPRARPIT